MELIVPVYSESIIDPSEKNFRCEKSVLPEIEDVDITFVCGNERKIAVQSELKQSLPCETISNSTLTMKVQG
jgi:hypothetical protein